MSDPPGASSRVLDNLHKVVRLVKKSDERLDGGEYAKAKQLLVELKKQLRKRKRQEDDSSSSSSESEDVDMTGGAAS